MQMLAEGMKTMPMNKLKLLHGYNQWGTEETAELSNKQKNLEVWHSMYHRCNWFWKEKVKQSTFEEFAKKIQMDQPKTQ